MEIRISSSSVDTRILLLAIPRICDKGIQEWSFSCVMMIGGRNCQSQSWNALIIHFREHNAYKNILPASSTRLSRLPPMTQLAWYVFLPLYFLTNQILSIQCESKVTSLTKKGANMLSDVHALRVLDVLQCRVSQSWVVHISPNNGTSWKNLTPHV